MMPILKNRIVFYCLLASHIVLLFAGFVAPYDPAEQFRNEALAPPTAIHFLDSAGQFHLRPSVEGPNATREPVYLLKPGAPYRLFGLASASLHLFGIDEPGHIFLFGSDAYGRDQFSRFLYGGQISVAVGLFATLLTLTIGAACGMFAGFYGGWRDSLIMRGSELFLALPWLYLLLAIRAFLPLNVSPLKVLFLLVGVIGVLGWARPARLVRGIVMSAKTLPYVSAAEQFGASNSYLMRRHLLPETYGVLLAQGALLIPHYIAAEVTLSFLGLGVAEPLSSWGSMLSAMRELSVVASYWWISIPALALAPLFMCYQFAAQNIQEMTVRRG
jgi:peptide/nickel transport system permease protein